MKRLIEKWWRKSQPLANRRQSIEVVPAHIHLRAANRWRDQYNPTRGLTIERAANLLEAGERGEYADLQWLYRFVEKRDTTLAALLARYDGGLLKLDWTIKETNDEGKFVDVVAATSANSDGFWVATNFPAGNYDVAAVSFDGQRKGDRRRIQATLAVDTEVSITLNGRTTVSGRVTTEPSGAS